MNLDNCTLELGQVEDRLSLSIVNPEESMGVEMNTEAVLSLVEIMIRYLRRQGIYL